MSNFVETWKGIATALGRSERWCRYMARRGSDPLPVFKVGGAKVVLILLPHARCTYGATICTIAQGFGEL